jgi:glycosyltransferase involved in cell wall biosynthesis
MGSVLATIRDYRVGGDLVSVDPTWIPDSPLRSAALTARAMLKIARVSSDEVIHVHLSERGSFVREGALLLLARRRGLTSAATIHGAAFLPFARRRRRFVAGVLGHADLITCLDREVCEVVRAMVPRARVELLANPVPLYSAIPPADETSELVLFAGEIGLRKGADVLCRAWARVARERPEAHCILVGPSTELKIGAHERLELRAPVAQAQMLELLARARVVTLPSRAEGMPMALTEAMSAGRPFVATAVGGIPELAAGGGGVLVPVGDADALAAGLVDFLADPGKARAGGERGRDLCARTRSVKVIDARLRELYAAVRYR